jgi:hypothetical protein
MNTHFSKKIIQGDKLKFQLELNKYAHQVNLAAADCL